MDEETHRPVVPGSGVVGRVARSGRIPLAYYKDPEKSAATFVEWDGRRWALTGDMGTVADDGTARRTARTGQSVHQHGRREGLSRRGRGGPAPVAAPFYDVVVVGVSDERWGQRVVAVVQPTAETHPTEGELMTLVRASLAGFKVPNDLSPSTRLFGPRPVRPTTAGRLQWRHRRKEGYGGLLQ